MGTLNCGKKLPIGGGVPGGLGDGLLGFRDRWRYDSDILDFGLRRQFLVGQNIEFRERGFKEALECQTKFGANDDGWRKPLFRHGVRADVEFAQKVLSHVCVQSERGFKVGALNAGDEGLFQPRIDSDGFYKAGLGFVLADKISSQSLADLFGEFVGIFCNWGVIGDRFENEWQIFDGDTFP